MPPSACAAALQFECGRPCGGFLPAFRMQQPLGGPLRLCGLRSVCRLCAPVIDDEQLRAASAYAAPLSIRRLAGASRQQNDIHASAVRPDECGQGAGAAADELSRCAMDGRVRCIFCALLRLLPNDRARVYVYVYVCVCVWTAWLSKQSMGRCRWPTNGRRSSRWSGRAK